MHRKAKMSGLIFKIEFKRSVLTHDFVQNSRILFNIMPILTTQKPLESARSRISKDVVLKKIRRREVNTKIGDSILKIQLLIFARLFGLTD